MTESLRRRPCPGASRACLIATSFVLAGCAGRTTGAAALPDQEYAGFLVTQVDANWFRPCGAEPTDPPLWVTFTGESIPRIESARSNGIAVVGDTAFVRWRAALTDERMVGPGGPALLVREIAVVRRAGEDDCR